jgi:3-oxoacyl-[acyl-carrier protein] reductase
MDLELRGRVVLLIGASKGIGFASASALAAEGSEVVLTGRDPASLADAAGRLARTALGSVTTIRMDATQREDIERAVEQVGIQWGRIDALVNVVGGAPGGRFEELDDGDWERALNPKLWSLIRSTRAALPHLRRSAAPRIVNIAGNSPKSADPAFPASVTVNSAMVGLSRCLARDLGPDGILVNVVSPGPIETERQIAVRSSIAQTLNRTPEEILERQLQRIALGRTGQPEDVGELVAFLASPRNRHLSGAVIDVDGAEAC